eukprot:scaffold32680_cov14-Tisochrysis_lutea.AAC.1
MQATFLADGSAAAAHANLDSFGPLQCWTPMSARKLSSSKQMLPSHLGQLLAGGPKLSASCGATALRWAHEILTFKHTPAQQCYFEKRFNRPILVEVSPSRIIPKPNMPHTHTRAMHTHNKRAHTHAMGALFILIFKHH